jgi:hypothetical protein
MLESLRSTTHRRGFLGRLGAMAATAGIAGLAPAGLAADVATQDDVAADEKFEAWLNRITGKHRIVFDAPEVNSGFPAVFPRVYAMTMNQTYGTTDKDDSVVLILRHMAAAMALQDAMWAKYKLGEELNIKEGDAFVTHNPYAVITGLPLPGLGVTELLKSGFLVGVCNVALTVESASLAKKTGGDAPTVKKELVDNLFPGIQVVPSGVMAVGRTQEKGCAYCFTG